MTDRSLFRSAAFSCVGVFTVALVSFCLFHLLADEENAVQFSDHPSDHPNMKHDDTQARKYDDSSAEDEIENGDYIINGWYLLCLYNL